ncbi:putative plasma-membrane choline transporter [Hamiltosporidium tvaerminnensis]|uniref:Protein PNS1 n=1 Tax=Hamiltosporidium tvaerminnensis TaxID=1176355 RepID=A0A4Q9M1V6_9MICR|nr:hypothetical protein LUQ84_002450 [Hamiltosporidium tvaerminnensis]TBU04521.1 putative plasma-membrane choline transporter [Hamiltosporidium tvaerminnensis]TBU19948.1 putative plasma-membrane choline transporter [Hamiltosporidium tvaerminnensis]
MNRTFVVKRRFNDAWAFFLFLASTIGVITYLLVGTEVKSQMEFNFDMGFALITLLYIVICISTMIGSFLFFPAFAMHFGCLVSPLLFLAIAVLTNNIIVIIFAIIGAVIGYLMYFLFYRKNIKYSAKVLKATTRIICKNILTILGMYSILFVLVMGIDILFDRKIILEKLQPLFYAIVILYGSWLFFNSIYFLRVCISTIVCMEIFKETQDSSIAKESVKNTLFCLGSICFGGLIIAVVHTMKHLVQKSNDRGERENILTVILKVLITLILTILEDIISFANDWCFCYMAVKGESYAKSMKSAFEKLTSSRNQILLNSLCTLPIIALFEFMWIAIYIAIFILYNGYHFENTIAKLKDRFIIFSIVSVLYTTMNFGTMFDSGCKAFLFAYSENPSAVAKEYPKVHTALVEQKRKAGIV